MINIQLGKQSYMTNEDYHASEAVSSSGIIKLINGTPAHYKNYLDNKEPPTDAMKFGTATHTAILETDRFKQTYVQKPDGMSFATKEGKLWKEENQGKEILSFDQYNDIRGIYASIKGHGKANELLSGGEAESSWFWKDEDTGLVCRCRPDYLVGNTIVDIKTTENAAPHKFQHSINTWRYDIQAAWYLRGLTSLNQEHYNFVFLVVEKSAPYAVALYELDDETLVRAHNQITQALYILKECKETNSYPGFDMEIQKLGAQYFGL